MTQSKKFSVNTATVTLLLFQDPNEKSGNLNVQFKLFVPESRRLESTVRSPTGVLKGQLAVFPPTT